MLLFATSSEVRYERSLQIREDIRDVNKCMYFVRKVSLSIIVAHRLVANSCSRLAKLQML